MKTAWQARDTRAAGFTLVELLAVIVVIALLAGMLFPAIAKAFDTARRGAALTEVRGIDSALRHYYTTYDRWPNTLPFIPDPEQDAVPIQAASADFAEWLQGRGSDPNSNNPRKLRFIEFVRFDASGDPITAWGKKNMQPPPLDPNHPYLYYYYAKFDTDYDNMIKGTGDPKHPPEKDIRAPVIVWTESPKGRIIGSWM